MTADKYALFLTTATPNNDIFRGSLHCCEGWVTIATRQDCEDHDDITRLVEATRPDVIVVVSAMTGMPGVDHSIPSIDFFKNLRTIAPTVYLSTDTVNPAWHALLNEYTRQECFTVGVSIDGTDWPGFLTKLPPVDISFYSPTPWSERKIRLGYMGSKLESVAFASPDYPGGNVESYELADFLCRCKAVINVPYAGGGQSHVKSRIIEAAFAGACVLEQRNPVTPRWFRPGVDYLEYDDPASGLQMAQWIHEHDDEARLIAANLSARVAREHSPQVFWRDVLAQLQR